jgi:hypothetical protein
VIHSTTVADPKQPLGIRKEIESSHHYEKNLEIASEPIRFRVELSKAEMVEALDQLDKIIVDRSDASPSFAYQIALAVPLGFALAHIFHIEESRAALLMIGALVILWIGSNILQTRFKRKFRSYIADDSTSRDVIYNFTDENIAVSARDFSGVVGWNNIKDVYKNETSVFLFLDNAHSYIIPTRIPESEDVFRIATSKVAAGSG